MSKKFSQIDFLNNLEYILINLENDKEKANSLENKIYFELSKDELINYINDDWTHYFWIRTVLGWFRKYISSERDIIFFVSNWQNII